MAKLKNKAAQMAAHGPKQKITGKLVKKNAMTAVSDFSSIIRLFAYLTRTGTSPQDTIMLLANEASGIFKEPFEQARDKIINEGSSIADGFASTNFFPNSFISILKVGQSSGKLSESLAEYSKYLDSVISAQRGFKSALKYPVNMLIAAIMGISAIVVVVVPKLKASIDSIASGKEINLPLPTKILFGLHDIMTIFGDVGVYCMMAGLLYYFTKGPGKDHLLKLISKIPKVRKLNNSISWAQFLVMSSICMRSGMTLPNMLYTMGEGELPPELAKPDVFKNLYFNVKSGGQTYASELNKAQCPSKLVALMAIGERKGAAEEVMQSYGEELMSSIPYEINDVKVTVESMSIGLITLAGGIIVACVLITMLNMSSFL